MFRSIAKYSFSPKSLRREIRADDFWKYSLRLDGIEPLTIACSDNLAKNNYSFEILAMIPQPNGKNLFVVGGIEDNLLIRRTNTILSTFVNHPVFDREEEIRQLSTIISTEPQARIFRTDISSFFESINFRQVIDKLCADGYNNLPSLKALRSIGAYASRQGHFGLPRGLSISSNLANYFMNDFDMSMRSIETSFYYSRYVDDIMIAFTDEDLDIEAKVKELLPSGLSLNTRKTQTIKLGEPGKIEYLGYSVSLSNGNAISVAKRKIGKTKTRICQAVVAYNKDHNYSLLEKRLRFLTCNTKMKMSGREKPVIVGFRYSYPLCTIELVLEQMKSLDGFLHRILNSKIYKPSRKLRISLTADQLKALNRLSFVNGYASRIKTRLTRNEIAEVKQAWKYG